MVYENGSALQPPWQKNPPYEVAWKMLLRNEGGFVNNPSDPGGATKFGISLRTLKQLNQIEEFDADLDGDLDEKDVSKITKDQAKDWYFENFWKPLGNLPNAIHIRLFDMAVNLGQKQAVILLQRAINQHHQKEELETDGILGKKTRNAAWKIVNQNIDLLISDQLVCFYIGLCNKRPELRVFYYGWLNRARMHVFFDHVRYQGS